MSKYTAEVRFICESTAGYNESQGLSKVTDIIDKSWNKIFNFDFELFDPEYKSVLCKKILMHYYTREIGFETVGLWLLKLQTKMTEIMPYFNQLYESAATKYNPMYDADYYRDHKGKDAGQGIENNNSSGSSTNYNLYSDTPQGSIVNVDNQSYLTNVTKDINSGNSSGNRTNSFSNTDEYIDHVYGKMPGKSYATLIKEWRSVMLNIDMQIIDALGDLFMKLW